MSKFIIKSHSNIIILAGILLSIALTILSAIFLFNLIANPLVFIGTCFGILAAGVVTTISMSRWKAEILIKEEGLDITFIKRTLLQLKSHLFIKWNDIDSYYFYEHRNNTDFKIMVKDQKSISFTSSQLELYDFFHAFENKILSLKNSNEAICGPKRIHLFETKSMLYLAYVSGIFSIGIFCLLIYILFFHKSYNNVSPPILTCLAAIAGLCYFTGSVLKKRKEKGLKPF